MQSDVPVEALKERNALTNHDRHDRIAHLVGESEAQAGGGYVTTTDKPDAAEVRLQSLVHQAPEIARVELDCAPGLSQRAMGEDEGRLVAVRPAQPLRLEIERRLISSRTHDVAVDRLEERLDEFRGHGVPALKGVRGFEPVDASVSSRNEAVETRGHVNCDSRRSVLHRHASLLR